MRVWHHDGVRDIYPRSTPIGMRRLSRIRVLFIALWLLVLSACTGSMAPSTGVPTAAPVSSERATLLLWHGWSGRERQVLGRLVEQFNRSSTSGRVILQSVPLATLANDFRSAVASGSGPHFILMPNTWIGTLAESETLLPLDEAIPADDLAALLPAARTGATFTRTNGNPQLYGLPIRFDTLALFYNAGNLLRPPATTDELLAAARGLSNVEVEPPTWGMAVNLSLDTTLGYLYAFGGRVFDDQGSLALGRGGRTGTEQWLAWVQVLHTDERLLAHPESSIAVDRAIQNNRAFMTIDWSYQIQVYRNLWGEQLGVAPLPRLSATGQLPQPYVRSDVLAVNARIGSIERDAAQEFLAFMISSAAQSQFVAYDLQPSRISLPLDGDSPQLVAARAFRSQAERGLPMPNAPTRGIVEQELKLMQRQVLNGLATPADAVAQADQRIRERLQLP